jgi:hypothetical protein
MSLQQGATWILSFEWLDDQAAPIDLTGCTAKMHMRQATGAPLLLELSTENGRISLAGATGVIELHVDAASTSLLTTQVGVYDLLVYHPNGQVDRVIFGSFALSLAVTK